MYPEGAGRCRRVAVAYAEGLPRAMARLEARRKKLEAFLRKREHGLETPWALSAELVESSIEATRRIEADLKARMNRTGALWEMNVRVLEAVCAPFQTVKAIAHLSEPASNLTGGSPPVGVDLLKHGPTTPASEGRDFILMQPGVSQDAGDQPSSRSDTGAGIGASVAVDPVTYDDPAQVLAHLVRDWTSLGARSREQLYGPILEALRSSESSSESGAVLVPGCGAGRLSWEIASRFPSLEVHGNDVSFGMLAVAHGVLSRRPKHLEGAPEGTVCSGCLEVAPNVHLHDANWPHGASRFGLASVPDTFPADSPQVLRRISFLHGDFTSLYRTRAFGAHFDLVATCFFIDTATNVVEYVETIRHVLKPGGVWVNHGPLQWHSEDALMLPLNEVLALIRGYGFSVTNVQRSEAEYGADDPGIAGAPAKAQRHEAHGGNMRPELYRPVFFVARLPLA